MKFLKSLGIGLLFGIATLIILLLISSAFLLTTDITPERLSSFGKIIICIASLVSGFISSLILKKTGWLIGILSGGIIWTLALGVGWLISEDVFSLSPLTLLLSLGAGLVGGMVANFFGKR